MSDASAKQKSVERLLASCEGLVSDKDHFQGKEWKLSQYVLALRKQVTELEKYSSVDRDTMALFQHKVAVLEELVHRQPTPQKAESMGSEEGEGGRGWPAVRESRLKRHQREKEERAELLGQSSGGATSLRHRGSGSSEVAMERHRRNQESIAEEMMGLARSLKENAMAAKNIIVNDNKLLKTTNEVAEQNVTAVDTQTSRIKEHNRGFPWGTLLLLVTVFLAFLAMVILIRFVPKPR